MLPYSILRNVGGRHFLRSAQTKLRSLSSPAAAIGKEVSSSTNPIEIVLAPGVTLSDQERAQIESALATPKSEYLMFGITKYSEWAKRCKAAGKKLPIDFVQPQKKSPTLVEK